MKEVQNLPNLLKSFRRFYLGSKIVSSDSGETGNLLNLLGCQSLRGIYKVNK